MKLTNEERDTIREGLIFLEERDFPEATELLRKIVKDECSTFTPDWASPPGDSIREIIEERYAALHPSVKQNPEVQVEALVSWLEVSELEARLLLEGRLTIDEDLAERLEKNLRGPAHFWLERERDYRRSLARLENSYISKDHTREMVDEIRAALGGLPENHFATVRGFVSEICEQLETIRAERDVAVDIAGKALKECGLAASTETSETLAKKALGSIAAICPSISGRTG